MSGQLIGRGYITIAGLKDGDPARTYVLVPSVESVTKKLDGTLSATAVSCSVYKVTGSSAYALSADHTLNYRRVPDGAAGTLAHSSGTSAAIAVLADTESIEFELKDGSKVIDRVRIPVLSDATDVNNELDSYGYLKAALNENTDTKDGLILSTLIQLGYTDSAGLRHTMAGMNGAWLDTQGGRTIGSWWGGPMVDLFDKNDVKKNLAAGTYATSLIRMDGTGYFVDGLFRIKKTGLEIGDTANGYGISMGMDGRLTLGNGIDINIGDNVLGLATSIASVTNLTNKIADLFTPYIGTEAKTWKQITDISAITSVKVNAGIWTDGFVSARGLNGNGGSGGGSGSGKSYLSDLLDVDLGALTSGQVLAWDGSKWVNSALTLPDMAGYALESWVEANYVTLGTKQTITVNKATKGNLHFVGAKPATGGKALGIYWDADSDPTATADSLGIGSVTYADSSGNVTERRLYLGWGASPWVDSTNLSVGANVFAYKGNSILHAGNYTSILDSRYVKKSGDTMTGGLSISMNGVTSGISNGNSEWTHFNTNAPSGFYFNKNVSVKGEIYAGSSYNQKVWHAGNDGSGSGLDADLLDGLHADDIRKRALKFSTFKGTATTGGYDLNTLAPDGGLISNYQGISYWANAPQNAQYGIAWHIKNGITSIDGMLFADINHGSATDVTRNLWWRASGTVNATKTWGKWHQIAFTDGNVASATKLADDTAFTAWGQTFFQTGKPKSVTGDMTGVGSLSASGEIKTISPNALRMVYGSFGTIFRNDGHDSFLLLTPEDTPNGNFNNLRPLRVSNSFGHVYLAGTAFTALHNGDVGIKTQTPQYTLDVNGTARAETLRIGSEAWMVYDDDTGTLRIGDVSCLSMQGTIYASTGIWSDGYVSARGQNTSSDERLKDILRDFVPDVRAVAEAPAVEFHWKDNGTMDVGSVAQYWQGVCPLLVTERPDGYLGLQYGKTALLSVISVARMTLDHESRIAELERENGELRQRLTELQTR